MNEQSTLFSLPEIPQEPKNERIRSAKPRVNSPVRNQVVMRCSSLDELLPESTKFE